MKGYYLFAPVEPECIGPESGVERKVRAQHKILQQYFDCELVILDPVTYSGSLSEKVIRRLPGTAAWRKWKYCGEFNDATFIYIRQVYHDSSFVRYLRDIRKQNPDIKIIYEIPTFPYDKQKKLSLSSFSFILKERFSRRKCTKYINRMVTFYGQKKIWNVPCFCLMNGFDFSSVILPIRSKAPEINIVSVSATAFWHGYNRLLDGLHKYYQNGGNENIIYHLVGDILPEHKKMIADYNLDKHVILYGRLADKELKDVYCKCLLGVNVLSGYSGSSPISSSLKSREYGAYGIPFFSSLAVDYLPEDYPFLLLVPHDDSPIDIQTLVDFYHNIYDDKDCNEIAEQIRSYALDRCDMHITMKPIIDWLLHNNS